MASPRDFVFRRAVWELFRDRNKPRMAEYRGRFRVKLIMMASSHYDSFTSNASVPRDLAMGCLSPDLWNHPGRWKTPHSRIEQKNTHVPTGVIFNHLYKHFFTSGFSLRVYVYASIGKPVFPAASPNPAEGVVISLVSTNWILIVRSPVIIEPSENILRNSF